jgi:hypothetical protein
MSERSALFLLVTGFFLTAFGVGGIESSLDDAGLLAGVAVSTVGLLIMWAGTLGLRRSDVY